MTEAEGAKVARVIIVPKELGSEVPEVEFLVTKTKRDVQVKVSDPTTNVVVERNQREYVRWYSGCLNYDRHTCRLTRGDGGSRRCRVPA